MPNVAGLYASLRVAIGRGTANDAVLPEWCQEAISELETDTTFKWMEKSATIASVAGPSGNVLALPSARVKAVDFIKPVTLGTGGQINYGQEILGVGAHDFLSVDAGSAPSAFYLDGVSNLVLDAIPSPPASFLVRYWEYTEWPADTSQTPPILARHYSGVKALIMKTVARNLRDERLAAVWAAQGEGAKLSMWIADGQTEFKHRRLMAQNRN